MPNWGYTPGVGTNIAFKRQLVIHPSFDTISNNYDRYRIPRPPEFDPEGTNPGKICWGTVGDMPSPEPLPTVGFSTKKGKEDWKETGRESQLVRVENPDDPSQYVMEDRPKKLQFNKTTNDTSPHPNTSSQVPDVSGFTESEQAGFAPSSGGSTSSPVSVEYSNPEGG